jgi:hypothetical protein
VVTKSSLHWKGLAAAIPMGHMRRALLGLVACAAPFAAPIGDAMAGAPRRGPVLKLHAPPLGPVLFSGDHRALYLFRRIPEADTLLRSLRGGEASPIRPRQDDSGGEPVGSPTPFSGPR